MYVYIFLGETDWGGRTKGETGCLFAISRNYSCNIGKKKGKQDNVPGRVDQPSSSKFPFSDRMEIDLEHHW